MKLQNKKICHVVSADMTVRFLLMSQLQSLQKEGYDVYVACSPGKLIPEIEQEGIYVKPIFISRSISPLQDLVSLWKLYWFFKQENFSIVHTHAPKPGLLGQLAAKMAGVPVIINTIHGLYVTEHSPYLKKRFFFLIEKIAAWCSTMIFSQNREDIQTMIAQGIAPANKIAYLGNGIDLSRFAMANMKPEFIAAKKESLGISANRKIVGTVGRLVQEKGYMDLLEAMKIVTASHPDVLLLCIGPKEPSKKDGFDPEKITKQFGLENNIMFVGQRQDVHELYPLMDIFVLASHREGFPRSVIEAMAMERAIIVTNIRGCREEIDDQQNGLMVPLKNPDSLAKAIIFLLENPVRAAEFAKAAHKKALAEFDERLVFNKLKEEYNRLIST